MGWLASFAAFALKFEVPYTPSRSPIHRRARLTFSSSFNFGKLGFVTIIENISTRAVPYTYAVLSLAFL